MTLGRFFTRIARDRAIGVVCVQRRAGARIALASGMATRMRDGRRGALLLEAIVAAQAACPNDYVPQIVLLSDALETRGNALAARAAFSEAAKTRERQMRSAFSMGNLGR